MPRTRLGIGPKWSSLVSDGTEYILVEIWEMRTLPHSRVSSSSVMPSPKLCSIVSCVSGASPLSVRLHLVTQGLLSPSPPEIHLTVSFLGGPFFASMLFIFGNASLFL